jgi:hypothetical protein
MMGIELNKIELGGGGGIKALRKRLSGFAPDVLKTVLHCDSAKLSPAVKSGKNPVSFIASLISISPDGVTKGIGNFEFVVTPRIGEKFSVNSHYATEEYEVVKLEHWPIEVPRDEQEKTIPRVLIYCSHLGFAAEPD